MYFNLIPVQYKSYSAADENNGKRVIHNISATVSETEIEMLPAIPIGSKIIFPEDHPLIRKAILQDAKISKATQEKLKCLLGNFEDTMSSTQRDIGYTKLIDVDRETDPNLPPVASGP